MHNTIDSFDLTSEKERKYDLFWLNANVVIFKKYFLKIISHVGSLYIYSVVNLLNYRTGWVYSSWIEGGFFIFLNKFIWVVMISGKDDVELAKCHLNVTGKGRVSVVWVESGVKWLLNCLFDHPSLVSVRFVIIRTIQITNREMFVKWFSHFVWSLFF